MERRFHRKILALAALWMASLPALADTQFQAKRMTRNDVPLGKGQCDIRLQIDQEAEVSVRGDRVYIRTISGRDGRDDGSECNEPLPARPVDAFNFEVRDSRGEIALLSEPSRRNDFRAVVRIRDNAGGEGRYHFRLSWRLDGGGSGPDRGGGGYGPGDRGPGSAFPVARAIDVCGQAVRDQIARAYRYNNVEISNARADDRPGRNDIIIGDATGRRGYSREAFIFSCQVDFSTGRVRSVDVRPR